MLEATLRAKRRALGELHEETAETMHWLGQAYYHRARDTDSERVLEECLSARKRCLAPSHPDIEVTESWLNGVTQ